MTALQILAAGIAHVCTPGPQNGWPHHIQTLLDQHDTAAFDEQAADYGTRAWLHAHAARIAAECGLARELAATPRPAAPLGHDCWLPTAA